MHLDLPSAHREQTVLSISFLQLLTCFAHRTQAKNLDRFTEADMKKRIRSHDIVAYPSAHRFGERSRGHHDSRCRAFEAREIRARGRTTSVMFDS